MIINYNPVTNGGGTDLRLKAALLRKTASGSVATFTDGADGLACKSVTVDIEPVQEGTGTPSPDNIRSISGYTSCTISHSGADTSNPETIEISWEEDAGTVYGGKLTINEDGSADLIKYYAKIDLSTVTSYQGSGINSFYKNLSSTTYNLGDGNTANPYLISDRFKTVAYMDLANHRGEFRNYCIATRNDSARRALYVYTEGNQSTVPTGTAILHYISSERPQYHFSDVGQLLTFLGTNNIWASCGDTTVEYYADATLAYEQLQNAIVSLGGNV